MADPAQTALLPHISTPGAPDAGKVALYAKSDGNLYYRNTGGNEVLVTPYTLVSNSATPSTIAERTSFGDLYTGRLVLAHPNASQNTAVGSVSNLLNATGSSNTAIGFSSSNSITTGDWNTAVGTLSLVSNQTGAYNTAIGTQAGYNTTGSNNVFLGYNAAFSVTTGSNLICLGSTAQTSSATATNEITLGNSSIARFRIPGLYIDWTNGTTVWTNTNDGSGSGLDADLLDGLHATSFVQTGAVNQTINGTKTFAGDIVVNGLTVGLGNGAISSNVAVGVEALKANTSGYENTSLGIWALHVNTIGNRNTSIGSYALRDTTGSNNTAIGYSAGALLTSGSNNILIGNNAAGSSATVSNEITLGNSSITRFRIPGLSIDWTNTTTVWTNSNDGSGSGLDADLLDGLDATSFVQTGSISQTIAGGKTFLNAIEVDSIQLGSRNTITSVALGNNVASTSGTFINTVAIGYSVASEASSIYSSVLIGSLTGQYLLSTNPSTAIGYSALRYVGAATKNTAVGYEASYLNGSKIASFTINSGGSGYTDGTYTNLDTTVVTGVVGLTPRVNVTVSGGVVTQVTVGDFPGIGLVTSSATQFTINNTLLGGAGSGLLFSAATGRAESENTSVGYRALYGGGSKNTAIGCEAGYGFDTNSSRNVAVGFQAMNNAESSVCVAIGSQALLNASGDANTAIGDQASYSTTTGTNNVSVGYYSLNKNLVGVSNTTLGSFSAQYTLGSFNTFAGANAGTGVNGTSSGSYNCGYGYYALESYTTGGFNVALGAGAGESLATGNQNVLVGYQSAHQRTNISNCIVLGNAATTSADSVSNEITLGNTSITRFRIPGLYIDWTNGTTVWTNANDGSGSGLDADLLDGLHSSTSSTGSTIVARTTDGTIYTKKLVVDATNSNIAVGDQAQLNNVTSAQRSIAIGKGLSSLTTGSDVIAIGDRAAHSVTTAVQSMFIGNNAGDYATTGSTNTVIGYDTGSNLVTSSNNVLLGNRAGSRIGTIANALTITNPGTGYTNGTYTNVSTSTVSGVVAYNPKVDITVSGGVITNVTVVNSGFCELNATLTVQSYLIGGTGSGLLLTVSSVLTGSGNTVIGASSLSDPGNGVAVNGINSSVIAIGYSTAVSAITTNSIFIGNNAGSRQVGGEGNTVVGHSALRGISNSTGFWNVALGSEALYSSTSASSNIAIGYQAGYNITTGGPNVLAGSYAGFSLTTSGSNICIGPSAGYALATGSQNVLVGYQSAHQRTNISNCIVLGNTATTSADSISNEITLGNSSINRLRVPGLGIDWTNTTDVWTSDNDGSGSGLDADLLDGSDSSAFVKNVQSVQVLTYAQGGTTYLNLTQGTTTCFSLTANGTGTTISHQNTPASGRVSFELHLDWTAGTISWPANWNKGMNPPTSTGEYIIQGVTINGGSNWTINVIYQ